MGGGEISPPPSIFAIFCQQRIQWLGCFYHCNLRGQADLTDTLNVSVKSLENFLETFEKNFQLKCETFSKHSSIIWTRLFQNLTKRSRLSRIYFQFPFNRNFSFVPNSIWYISFLFFGSRATIPGKENFWYETLKFFFDFGTWPMMTFYSNLNFSSKKLAQFFFQKNIFLIENLNFPDWSNCHSGMFWKYSEKQESVFWVSKMNLEQWWMHDMVSKASIMDFVPKNLSSIFSRKNIFWIKDWTFFISSMSLLWRFSIQTAQKIFTMQTETNDFFT